VPTDHKASSAKGPADTTDLRHYVLFPLPLGGCGVCVPLVPPRVLVATPGRLFDKAAVRSPHGKNDGLGEVLEGLLSPETGALVWVDLHRKHELKRSPGYAKRWLKRKVN